MPAYDIIVLIAFSSTGRFTLLGEAQGKLCREYGEQDILKYLFCVNRYGYLEEMAEGKTIICGVRKLDDIDTPYITCEVSLNDNEMPEYVIQYYRAFNECPDAPDEREFLDEFTKFIHNHE